MEDIIREGSLRLYASESCCDVIISCMDCKLMAHKIILSIASPVLQELLQHDSFAQPSVLIFPDITSTTMTLVLDYMYNGYVSVLISQLGDFLSVADLLKLKLQDNEIKSIKMQQAEKMRRGGGGDLDGEQKCKKLPGLIPIVKVKHKRKGLFNKVIPSPWIPREPLEDPRLDRTILGNADNNNNNAVERAGYSKNSSVGDDEDNLRVPLVERQSSLINSEATSVAVQQQAPPVVTISAHHEQIGGVECTPPPIQPSTQQPPTKEKEKTQPAEKSKHKPFKCEDCDKSFSQLRNYKYHRSIHEGTKEFSTRCPECGKVFNDRGYLSSHMKIHRDRKEYACQHCPKRFNQRVAYNMHLRIHTGVKPHVCTDCGKSFSRKMLLKQHQRVHTGERPYTCSECGKSFADRSNMSLHARLHTGVKPYSCTLCPKSFTKKHHLKTHMNFHTGLKPYSCEKCGLSFSQSSNMRTHYKKCILKTATDNT